MKYIITLITIISFSNAIFAQDNGETKINGFRAFEWGKEVTEMKQDGQDANFILSEKMKDGIYYILANENLMIGNVLLSEIKYVFSKKDDKFYKVVLVGKKEDVDQMKFIVEYKYGESVNEMDRDDKEIKQWIVGNVMITLKDYSYNKFELVLESNWEAAEAYKKNTNVSDF